jgi:ABC-2 type transport system permease protein
MIRSVRSELLKLRRPSVLFGGGGAMLTFALLATVLAFLTADAGPGRPTNGNDIALTLDQLGSAGGLTRGFSIAAGFIGLLVFVVFLTSVTSEYVQGTLRGLLTRQPKRGRLLAGKLVALLACTAVALLTAEVVSAAAAVALAGVRDVPTGEWFTGTGLLAAAGDYANALLNATFFGMLGAGVGVILRSTVLALGVGLAWLMPIEHIIQNAWAGAGRWFPGLLFEAVARGGTEVTSYQRSLVLATAAAGLALIAGTATFVRRDVST